MVDTISRTCINTKLKTELRPADLRLIKSISTIENEQKITQRIRCRRKGDAKTHSSLIYFSIRKMFRSEFTILFLASVVASTYLK